MPPGPLFWRIENFPTPAAAKAAAGPTGLAAEVAGKVWLFTLGPKGGATPEDDARIIHGENGREVLQVRTPLGIEQYETEGRPDGARPHGMESSLEHHLRRLEEAKITGKETDFRLSESEEGVEQPHEGRRPWAY